MVGTLHSGLETGRELIDRSQLQPMLVSRPFLPVGLKLRAAILIHSTMAVHPALTRYIVVRIHVDQPVLILEYLVSAQQ